jgi:acyl-coenzyme A synthetase/AMP-(fatty) acid ligase
VASLPRTRSGATPRRALRVQELGAPAVDVSTTKDQA